MTAWGDGVPGPQGSGTDPNGGPAPRRNDDTRIIAIVVMFTTAIVLVGIGAFLVGRGASSDSRDPVVAGATSVLDAPMITPTSAPGTAASTTLAPTATAPPTTAAPSTTLSTTSTTTTSTTTSTTTPPLVDNSARARADLQVHFDNHARVDLDAAYTGLSESFAPPFDEFVAFWGTEVATVDSPIDDCTVTGSIGTCRVRFFITYSDAAPDASRRGNCIGQLVELTLQETNGRFLIDRQREIEPLVCP